MICAQAAWGMKGTWNTYFTTATYKNLSSCGINLRSLKPNFVQEFKTLNACQTRKKSETLIPKCLYSSFYLHFWILCSPGKTRLCIPLQNFDLNSAAFQLNPTELITVRTICSVVKPAWKHCCIIRWHWYVTGK